MGNKQTGSKKSASTKTESAKTASKKSASKLVTNQTLPPHRRRCIIIKNAKHRGEWAELNFMARVTERGFNVSKPWGDSTRYDVAVQRHGHLLPSPTPPPAPPPPPPPPPAQNTRPPQETLPPPQTRIPPRIPIRRAASRE